MCTKQSQLIRLLLVLAWFNTPLSIFHQEAGDLFVTSKDNPSAQHKPSQSHRTPVPEAENARVGEDALGRLNCLRTASALRAALDGVERLAHEDGDGTGNGPVAKVVRLFCGTP